MGRRPRSKGRRRCRCPYRNFRQVTIIRSGSSGHSSSNARVGGIRNCHDGLTNGRIPVGRIRERLDIGRV